jgi:predicted dehydrogenase
MKASFSPALRPLNRRQFLKQSSLALAAGAAAVQPGNLAGPVPEDQILRVGLVGCGGRGTGAAAQALMADSKVRLTALGDAFEDRLRGSLATLQKQPEIAGKIDVPEERFFVGFDAYRDVIEHSDVVLLATPPHFRPAHIEAAVAAGRHIFAEKPVAVDAPGIRRVLAACEEARKKKLSVVSGLALRYSYGYQELMQKLRQGAIGEIRALQANDFRGPLWVRKRAPGWSDMEYHMRNWYYFTWLSGDFNVEQHVHMLDVCSWVMQDEYPVKAYGTGGRQVRVEPEYGNIYDHHAVIYEYANGTRLFAVCRQMHGCMNDISTLVTGAKGNAVLSHRLLEISADSRWRFDGERNNAQQTELDELFASIRTGEPIDNGDYMTKSTLMAIMGRMATYTGQAITWEQALHSKEDLSPSSYDWDAQPPVSEIAIPGQTRFV